MTGRDGSPEADLDLRKATHRALANVDTMIPGLRYNAAVAQIYTLVNTLDQSAKADGAGTSALKEAIRITLQMIAPMMPHLAEECWSALGEGGMISEAAWPQTDDSLLEDDTLTLPVQINGKKRGDITWAKDATKSDIEQAVLEQGFVQAALSGTSPKKVIVVPGRIVNVVV